MILNQLRYKVTSEVAFWRKVERVTRKDHFGVLWDEATVEQQDQLLHHLDKHNINGLKQWVRIRSLANQNLSSWPMTKLRPMGRDLNVFDYHRLRKDDLVHAIKERLDEDAQEQEQQAKATSTHEEGSGDSGHVAGEAVQEDDGREHSLHKRQHDDDGPQESSSRTESFDR